MSAFVWAMLLALPMIYGWAVVSSPACRYPVTIAVAVAAIVVFGFIAAMRDHYDAAEQPEADRQEQEPE